MSDEILLTKAPVKKQVLGEEGRGNHAQAVVHVSCLTKRPHCSVDDGVTSLALRPSAEMGIVVFPLDVCIFEFERFVHADDALASPGDEKAMDLPHIGPMHEHMSVEVSPRNF